MNRYQPNIESKRVLVTVKAYPQPSRAYRETVCVAGVTDEGKWIRLFPVTFRTLDEGSQFKMYTWVRVNAWKTPSDPRPESFHIESGSIQIESTVGTSNNWAERWNVLRPLVRPSLEALKAEQKVDKTSLGLIKPREILELIIDTAEETKWSSSELEKLLRQDLFDLDQQKRPLHLLEKIPFRFAYRFLCGDANCQGHNLSMISWEVMESYRKWFAEYGQDLGTQIPREVLELHAATRPTLLCGQYGKTPRKLAYHRPILPAQVRRYANATILVLSGADGGRLPSNSLHQQSLRRRRYDGIHMVAAPHT